MPHLIPDAVRWLTQYKIKRVIDAPTRLGHAGPEMREAGVEYVLGVDARVPGEAFLADEFVQANLETYRPPDDFDLAYVNCFFCLLGDRSNGLIGSQRKVATNMTTWPVQYFLFVDSHGFRWEPIFEAAGWHEAERVDFEYWTHEMRGHCHTAQLWSRLANPPCPT